MSVLWIQMFQTIMKKLETKLSNFQWPNKHLDDHYHHHLIILYCFYTPTKLLWMQHAACLSFTSQKILRSCVIDWELTNLWSHYLHQRWFSVSLLTWFLHDTNLSDFVLVCLYVFVCVYIYIYVYIHSLTFHDSCWSHLRWPKTWTGCNTNWSSMCGH